MTKSDMMYDPDVFFLLIADDDFNMATSAFQLQHNTRWFRKATDGVEEIPIINSREATPADQEGLNDEPLRANNCLVVTFSEIFRTLNDETLKGQDLKDGIQFGTDPRSSHILLGCRGTRGVSAKQYIITVDDELCIWLCDYHSKYGTAVGGDEQNTREARRQERWILAHSAGTKNIFKTISISSGKLAIRVEFPNHPRAEPEYIENLQTFVAASKKAKDSNESQVPAVERLGLDSNLTTGAPSECQTPRKQLIYYKKELIGKGAFGEVHRSLQARTGRYFASKTFLQPTSKRKRDDTEPVWVANIRREFTIMIENPHVGVP